MTTHDEKTSLARRLMWFAALWLTGVGTVTLLSFGLRLWLAPR
jgi:hypothetical protein